MKIAIGSVLKPLTDIRHYYKIARTLSEEQGFKIYVLAKECSPISLHDKNIEFRAITSLPVTLSGRFFSSFRFFLNLIRIKPGLVIICTHELLIPACIYKIISRSSLIYDIQENYSLNIDCNLTYKPLVKRVLSSYVKLKERICAPFINRFWLAEPCYKDQLPFTKHNSDVFLNKSLLLNKKNDINLRENNTINLLFSGTIAKETGVYKAILLAERLHSLDSRYQLTVTGCCHNAKTYSELTGIIKDKDFITNKISREPVDYLLIKEEIMKADIGIISYSSQKNFEGKAPTKLFEYLSVSMPVLLDKSSAWYEIPPDDTVVWVDFEKPDADDVHSQLQNRYFFTNKQYRQSLLWEPEKRILHESVKKVLSSAVF